MLRARTNQCEPLLGGAPSGGTGPAAAATTHSAKRSFNRAAAQHSAHPAALERAQPTAQPAALERRLRVRPYTNQPHSAYFIISPISHQPQRAPPCLVPCARRRCCSLHSASPSAPLSPPLALILTLTSSRRTMSMWPASLDCPSAPPSCCWSLTTPATCPWTSTAAAACFTISCAPATTRLTLRLWFGSTAGRAARRRWRCCRSTARSLCAARATARRWARCSTACRTSCCTTSTRGATTPTCCTSTSPSPSASRWSTTSGRTCPAARETSPEHCTSRCPTSCTSSTRSSSTAEWR